MTQGSQNLVFKKVYTFPTKVEDRIWKIITDYQKKVDRQIYVLHCPSGESRLGKSDSQYYDPVSIGVLNFDIDQTVNPDIVGDIYTLNENPQIQEFLKIHKISGFDIVLSDPIWIEQKTCRCRNCGKITAYKNPKGVQYHKRRYISYQLRDVLKKDGLFIMNCLWNPYVKGLKKDWRIETQMDYNEFENLDSLVTGETIYQSFSSFRNVSLLWVMEKE